MEAILTLAGLFVMLMGAAGWTLIDEIHELEGEEIGQR